MQEKDQAMMQLQVSLAKAETDKARAQLGTAAAKAEESAAKLKLDHQAQINELQTEKLKLQLESYKMLANAAGQDQDTQFKYDHMENQAAIEITRIETASGTEQEENFKQNKEAVSAD